MAQVAERPSETSSEDQSAMHLMGTGLGAAVAGAAVGAVGAVLVGVPGLVAGAAIGAFVGGLAGEAAQGYADPSIEEAYWRAHFQLRPYVAPGSSYERYAAAYRFGWESRSTYRDFDFHEVERDLAEAWESKRQGMGLNWNEASPAVLDAWNHVEDRPRTDLKEWII